MTVGAFCNREVVIAGKDTDILKVAQLMRHHHVGDIIVVDSETDFPKPIGIITDRDIVVELVASGIDPSSVTAGDVMSFELVTAREEDSIWETIQGMRSGGIRRMPVINRDGVLEGILAVDDLLELLADELAMLSKVPERQKKKEEKSRE